MPTGLSFAFRVATYALVLSGFAGAFAPLCFAGDPITLSLGRNSLVLTPDEKGQYSVQVDGPRGGTGIFYQGNLEAVFLPPDTKASLPNGISKLNAPENSREIAIKTSAGIFFIGPSGDYTGPFAPSSDADEWVVRGETKFGPDFDSRKLYLIEFRKRGKASGEPVLISEPGGPFETLLSGYHLPAVVVKNTLPGFGVNLLDPQHAAITEQNLLFADWLPEDTVVNVGLIKHINSYDTNAKTVIGTTSRNSVDGRRARIFLPNFHADPTTDPFAFVGLAKAKVGRNILDMAVANAIRKINGVRMVDRATYLRNLFSARDKIVEDLSLPADPRAIPNFDFTADSRTEPFHYFGLTLERSSLLSADRGLIDATEALLKQTHEGGRLLDLDTLSHLTEAHKIVRGSISFKARERSEAREGEWENEEERPSLSEKPLKYGAPDPREFFGIGNRSVRFKDLYRRVLNETAILTQSHDLSRRVRGRRLERLWAAFHEITSTEAFGPEEEIALQMEAIAKSLGLPGADDALARKFAPPEPERRSPKIFLAADNVSFVAGPVSAPALRIDRTHNRLIFTVPEKILPEIDPHGSPESQIHSLMEKLPYGHWVQYPDNQGRDNFYYLPRGFQPLTLHSELTGSVVFYESPWEREALPFFIGKPAETSSPDHKITSEAVELAYDQFWEAGLGCQVIRFLK